MGEKTGTGKTKRGGDKLLFKGDLKQTEIENKEVPLGKRILFIENTSFK